MKILTIQGSLRTELFKEVMLHERLGIIALNYSYRYEEDGEQATEYIVQIPLTFRSRRRARHRQGERESARIQLPMASKDIQENHQ